MNIKAKTIFQLITNHAVKLQSEVVSALETYFMAEVRFSSGKCTGYTQRLKYISGFESLRCTESWLIIPVSGSAYEKPCRSG